MEWNNGIIPGTHNPSNKLGMPSQVAHIYNRQLEGCNLKTIFNTILKNVKIFYP